MSGIKNVQLLESRKSREAAGGNTGGGYANDYTPADNAASARTNVPHAEDGDETLVISSDDLPF